MAEALGLLSSLVACYEVLTPALKYCGQLYNAPRELKALQDQIAIFDAVIQSIEKRDTPAQSPILAGALEGGRTVVGEINNFITNKFHAGHTKRRSCSASWVRNRRKFVRFGEKLERNRSRIKEALLTEVYIQLQPPVLMSIPGNGLVQEIAPSDSKLHAQDLYPLKSLGDWNHHSDNVCTDLAVTSQPKSCSRWSNQSIDCQVSNQGNGEHIATSRASLPLRLTRKQDRCFRNTRAEPVSVFETLSTFRPEVYAENADKRVLYTYFVEEAQTSAVLRVTECALFYLSAPRRWTRITASIYIPHKSNYWSVTRSRRTSLGVVGNYDLPITLNSKVEAYLAKYVELAQDCHLDVFITNDNNQGKTPTNCTPSIELTKRRLSLGVQQLLERATEAIAHLNLPWYEEGQLDMRQAYRFNSPDNFFYAWLESRWVYACRFGTEAAHVNIDLYSLEVLFKTRGSPGVAQLLGVFSEKAGTGVISGFLVELPAKGKWKGVPKADSIAGKEELLQRKLRWCRDLLQGLASIHERGLIAGGMFSPGCRTGIDSEDRALFYGGFSTQIDTFGMRHGVLPPEYQSLTVNNGHMNGTYRTDLYSIGFIMWTILEDEMWPSPCTLASCDTPADTVCTTSHPNAVQLRSIDQSVPAYMRKIISICRSEDPVDREPACKLLKLFPDDMGSSVMVPRAQDPLRLLRVEDCYTVYRCFMSCYRCGAVTTPHQYYCNLCGDYDICPKYFRIGYHCRDNSHWLRESFQGMKNNRYYTALDNAGRRQLIIV